MQKPDHAPVPRTLSLTHIHIPPRTLSQTWAAPFQHIEVTEVELDLYQEALLLREPVAGPGLALHGVAVSSSMITYFYHHGAHEAIGWSVLLAL